MIDRIAEVRKLGAVVTFEERYDCVAGEHVEIDGHVAVVNVGWTPEQWMQVAQREGRHYLGGCCGSMSAVQDVVNSAFRDGGVFDADAMAYVGLGLRQHDGTDEDAPARTDAQFMDAIGLWKRALAEIPKRDKSERMMIDPWFQFGVVFSAVEDKLSPLGSARSVATSRYPRDTDERYAMRKAANTLQYLEWEDFFDAGREDGQHDAQRLLNRSKVIEPLRTILAKLESDYTDDVFEGFAIVDAGTDEIRATGRGPAIYAARDDAQSVVDVTNKSLARNEEVYDRDPKEQKDSEIVRVRVTVEKGVEILR